MTRRIALAVAIAACLTLFTACQQPEPKIVEPELIEADTPDGLQPEQAPEQPELIVVDSSAPEQAPKQPTYYVIQRAPEPIIEPEEPVAAPSQPDFSSDAPPVFVPAPSTPTVTVVDPAVSSPTTSSAPSVVSPVSSAPEITYNPDGSYGFIGGGSSSTGMEKREPTYGGHTLEQAQSYLAYAKEYAESIGLVWSESAKDGGHEPAVSLDTADVNASIEFKLNRIKENCTYVYASIEPDSFIEDEYQIVFYR